MTIRKLQEFLPENQENIEVPTTTSFERETITSDLKEVDICLFCDGMGFVRVTNSIDDSRFGQSYPCSCTISARNEKISKQLLNQSGLGSLRRLNFENLISHGRTQDAKNREQYKLAAQEAKAYASNPNKWLTIIGEHGSGKTHLAAAIANASLNLGRPTLFFSVLDLMEHFRKESFGRDFSESDTMTVDRIFNIPLLIIDDCHSKINTTWAQEKFNQLLNHRWNAQLPTVFTTPALNDAIATRLNIRLSDSQSSYILDLGIWEASTYSSLGAMTEQVIKKYTFDNFLSDGIGLSAQQSSELMGLESRLREWSIEPDGWIVLTGNHGVGKTHLASAIANVRLSQGDRVAFATVPDLLDHLRASYNQESQDSYDQVFRRLLEVQLLILDDLGAHKSSDWAEEKIYQLINHRYLARSWTIITMNGKPSELEPRLASRLTFTELSEVYRVDAQDFRTLRPGN